MRPLEPGVQRPRPLGARLRDLPRRAARLRAALGQEDLEADMGARPEDPRGRGLASFDVLHGLRGASGGCRSLRWPAGGRSARSAPRKARTIRHALLGGHGLTAPERPSGAGVDDLLDACAAAWSAGRLARGDGAHCPTRQTSCEANRKRSGTRARHSRPGRGTAAGSARSSALLARRDAHARERVDHDDRASNQRTCRPAP